MSPAPCLALRFALLAAAASAHAAPAPAQAQNETPGAWRFGAGIGAAHQFDADIDGGGSLAVDRWFAQGSVGYAFDRRTSVGLGIGGGVTDYDFSGAAVLGGASPWGTINDLRVSLPVRFSPFDRVDAYVIGSVRWNAEDGASLDDGRTEGVLAGAAYRVSDRLSIGPGVGVFSSIEGDASVFPILLLDWRITDTLSLGIGQGVAATQGPGLALSWTPTDDWTLGLGARSEDARFRLDDRGRAPGGVGEDEGLPVYATATWRPVPMAEISAIGGVKLGGSLRLEDAAGRFVAQEDYDPAPFLGLSGSLRF
jgi:hypothetical protein